MGDLKHAWLVAVGGAIGATMRFAFSLTLARTLSPRAIPVATLLINWMGCLAIGYLALTLAAPPEGSRARNFWMTGVLGGFTTFSAFALESWTLADEGKRAIAVGYVLASVVGCLACAAIGMRLAR